MIRDNFYPDVTTQLSTGEKFTAYVPSIPITTEQAPSAYWLGWISKDNLPQAFRHSEISLNNNGYQFSDITPEDNFDCGYNFKMPANHTYYADTPFRMVRYQTGVSKWQANEGNQNSNNFCFGNYINCMSDAISKVEIYVRFTIYDNNDTVVRRSMSNSAALLKSFSFEEFISFLNGGIVTITFGEQGNIDITKQDLETGYFSKESTLGYTVETFVNAYKFIHTRSVNSNNTTDQGSTSKSSCFMAHINTEKYGDTIISGDDTGQGSVMQWDKRYPTQILDKILIWGLHGYFSFDDIDSLSWNGKRHIYNGNVLVFKPDNTYVLYVAAIFPIGEIEKHFNLCMRMSKARLASVDPYAPYYGYIENDVYAPYITKDNEFTATRITGDLEDPEFLDKLRPWQYDITKWEDNDYKEEDRPPYTPGGDDNENIGDKITRPATLGIGGTNGFVTLYALRKSDIAQLGAILWTSFIDADYWKNYLFSLALDTGTFSLAGLLNFFVSCRVYPFSLINIAGCTSFGRSMYVGTGTVPLEFTEQTTLHVLTDMVDYISGGYCDVPRHFNDWRDYVNTEIILYVPYCGTLRLNPGDVIGNRISVQYAIDFATGGCIAYVDMLTGDGAGYPVGALPGQIGADIPLTATAAGEIAARFIGDALNVGGIIADEAKSVGTGLAGAAAGDIKASGSAGSALSGMAAMMGGPMAAVAADMAIPMAKQGLTMLTRGAVAAPMLSGGRGFASFGAPQVPYIQIRRGIYPEISKYATIEGEPAAATTTIGSLSGFIQGTVKVESLSCHQAEKEEIIALISSGIYV